MKGSEREYRESGCSESGQGPDGMSTAQQHSLNQITFLNRDTANLGWSKLCLDGARYLHHRVVFLAPPISHATANVQIY